MNTSRNRAVASLERWRRFQEARAAIAHSAAQAGLAQAASAFEEAGDVARSAQAHRAALLSAPLLDLDHCRAVGEIEAHLWRHAAQCEAALTLARESARQAMQDHRDTHALTDVTTQRRERLDRDAQDHDEKTASDRLADLRSSTMRHPA